MELCCGMPRPAPPFSETKLVNHFPSRRLHPSALPRYAGYHPLSWALLNRERSHGIAWHMVEDMSTSRQLALDGGKVWFSRSFDLAQVHEPNFDTRGSLVHKCTKCVIESFPDLLELELLKRGECGSEANDQNSKIRSKDYHPRYARPAMVVQWNVPYEEVFALHQARLTLTLTLTPNPDWP